MASATLRSGLTSARLPAARAPSCSARVMPCRSRAGPTRAAPEGGEDISDAMKADLERYRQRAAASQPAPTAEASQSTTQQLEGGGETLKDKVDKFLIADFFVVMFVLAWLVAGVVQSATNGGESPLLDAWYPLWPILWQPAIGILMLGALVSGGLAWLRDRQESPDS